MRSTSWRSTYFYPRPPRGGRPRAYAPDGGHAISIHALREEGDTTRPEAGTPEKISIHALREEGDFPALDTRLPRPEFLSTPSARRATSGSLLRCPSRKISIHALREEGDQSDSVLSRYSTDFYPRPPRGGRPGNDGPVQRYLQISIHALREEGDGTQVQAHSFSRISIHALREEGDFPRRSQRPEQRNFYPRPPRGGRPKISPNRTSPRKFLSTPSARRATVMSMNTASQSWAFLSTPSARRATPQPERD